jgi:hypothetical protein
LIVALVGIPVLVFLAVATEGAILLPVEGLLLLAPLAVLHYSLWGRSFSRGVAAHVARQGTANGPDEPPCPR